MSLYPHQLKVFELLLDGKNVILSAPTGSGKTRAALYPFLTASDKQSKYHNWFPTKCVYSAPMRVLANQFYVEYDKIVRKYNQQYALDITVSIQTGEQQQDRNFNSNLIFATIDQTLSSHLLSPYSQPKRKANINAGALVGSFLIFDEFHLYDPQNTLPTLLIMLKQLKNVSPFILMTATYSQTMLEQLGELLDAEIIPVDESERKAYESLPSQNKKRFYQVANQPLSSASVLEKHDKRSIVICNTVNRARNIYDKLRSDADPQTKVLLLHSQFLDEDRKNIEKNIQDIFGLANVRDDYILVATQAIEVGVDITSTSLHTEVAPANSIIQRAGRCARYEGNTGHVYIYKEHNVDDEIIDLVENPLPYKNQSHLFIPTLKVFQEYEGNAIGFQEEQSIVNQVHQSDDERVLTQLNADEFNYRRRVLDVQQNTSREDARNLIRHINNQAVTISSNLDELLKSPFEVPSFSLHPGTLQGNIHRWLDEWFARDDIEWAVKYLKEDESENVEGENQSNRSVYRWIDVNDNPKQVLGSPLVVVNPMLSSYSQTEGFIADRGGTWEAKLPDQTAKNRSIDGYKYRLETYEQHIKLVYNAFKVLWQEVSMSSTMLERTFGWQSGSIQRATELAVMLHDVGKLSIGWQKWVWDYQERIDNPVDSAQAYAHTDFDPKNPIHVEAQKLTGKRPWHAVESAFSVAPMVFEEVGNTLGIAVISAIARHHAPFSDSHQAYRLVRKAPLFIEKSFQYCGVDKLDMSGLLGTTETFTDDGSVRDLVAQPDEPNSFLPYLIICRVLRLADQQGTEYGSKKLI